MNGLVKQTKVELKKFLQKVYLTTSQATTISAHFIYLVT